MQSTISTTLLFIILSFSAFSQVGLKKGEVAPDFTILDPQGNELKLSDLRGKTVLLDFWASWCLPCRMANPELVSAYSKFHAEGFEIFSISLDTRKDAWVKAIKNDSLYWPYHGSDLKGWHNEIGELYGVEMIPTSFLINEKGVIIEEEFDVYDLDKKLKYLYWEQVNMYPNVVKDTLYFTDKIKFVVEDTAGNVVLKEKNTFADVSKLDDGMYLCKYEHKTEIFTKETFSDEKLTFYPRKVSDEITLSRKAHYEIITGRGKVKAVGEGQIIDMSSFPTGMYYLSLEGKLFKIFKK